MKDYTCSFNPLKDYFIILRRFEGFHAIIGKDYTNIILGRDEGLHMFLQPFECCKCDPSKGWRVVDVILPPYQGWVVGLQTRSFNPTKDYERDSSKGWRIACDPSPLPRITWLFEDLKDHECDPSTFRSIVCVIFGRFEGLCVILQRVEGLHVIVPMIERSFKGWR